MGVEKSWVVKCAKNAFFHEYIYFIFNIFFLYRKVNVSVCSLRIAIVRITFVANDYVDYCI